MSLFLLFFFLVYGGTHVYFFLKARGAFGFGPSIGVPLVLFLALMTVAPVLVRLAERHGYELAARMIAWTGYLWMGLLFFFLTASLAIDLCHLLIKGGGALLHRDTTLLLLGKGTAFGMAVAYGVLATLAGYVEARDIRTRRIVIPTTKLPASAGKLTIVQISDVHLGLIIRQGRLARILEKVGESNPDVLISTGDLVDGQINKLEGLADMLGRMQPRFGKYAVTGNHEYHAGLEQALAFTEKAGFTILRGEGHSAGGVINIAGVDDPAGLGFGRVRGGHEKEILSILPQDKFTLFLKHRPLVDRDSLGFFDLQASGHTHHGQIFPFTLFIWMVYPEDSGLTRLGHSFLYVSRGTGTWGPPIRFLVPPEVTIYEIQHDGAPR